MQPKEGAISLETEEPSGATGGTSGEVIAKKEAKEAKTAVTAAVGGPKIKAKADDGSPARQDAKAAVKPNGKETPTVAAPSSSAAGQAKEPTMAIEENVPASPASKKKEKAKDGFTAQPETTAAEKVHVIA